MEQVWVFSSDNFHHLLPAYLEANNDSYHMIYVDDWITKYHNDGKYEEIMRLTVHQAFDLGLPKDSKKFLVEVNW